jgi:hypothetical protein
METGQNNDDHDHEDVMFHLQLKNNTAGHQTITSSVISELSGVVEPAKHVSARKERRKRHGFGKTKTIKFTAKISK